MTKLDYSLYYKKWHDGSERDFEATARFYQRLLGPPLGSTSFDARTLDLGCGQGLLVYALGKMGFRDVRGIDVSEEQIVVAQRHGLNCRAVSPDYIHSLAAESPATFDRVFMLDVLEHLDRSEQLRVLRAVWQLLAPSGKLILSVPNANSSFGLRWRYNDWTHEASFTEHSLEFLLLNSCFSDVRFWPYEFIPLPQLPFIPRKTVAFWVVRRIARLFRRLEAIGELGDQGFAIPLSLNLLAECVKSDAKL